MQIKHPEVWAERRQHPSRKCENLNAGMAGNAIGNLPARQCCCWPELLWFRMLPLPALTLLFWLLMGTKTATVLPGTVFRCSLLICSQISLWNPWEYCPSEAIHYLTYWGKICLQIQNTNKLWNFCPSLFYIDTLWSGLTPAFFSVYSLQQAVMKLEKSNDQLGLDMVIMSLK